MYNVHPFFTWWDVSEMCLPPISPKLIDGMLCHDDVSKLKHFPRHWPCVQVIHQSPVNSPHEDQWHGALVFFFISAWINGWVNNRETGDLRCHHTHYDVTVKWLQKWLNHYGEQSRFVCSNIKKVRLITSQTCLLIFSMTHYWKEHQNPHWPHY